MRTGGPPIALLFALCILVWPVSGATATETTRVTLADESTGREIFSSVLQDGEPVVLIWKNSLYGLHVTEIFRARAGQFVLTEVTFADPDGSVPPAVREEDLDDLYQTGGAFSVRGLSKSFRRVVFRVGEIGDPKLKCGDRVIELKKEVGFGGAVVLTVAPGLPRNNPQ
jgi:hypothetical protein